MQVTFDLPEGIAHELQARWSDLSRHALEALVVEDYRSGALTEFQAQQILGFGNRIELHCFLREHGAFLVYSAEELDEESKTSQHLQASRQNELGGR